MCKSLEAGDWAFGKLSTSPLSHSSNKMEMNIQHKSNLLKLDVFLGKKEDSSHCKGTNHLCKKDMMMNLNNYHKLGYIEYISYSMDNELRDRFGYNFYCEVINFHRRSYSL